MDYKFNLLTLFIIKIWGFFFFNSNGINYKVIKQLIFLNNYSF